MIERLLPRQIDNEYRGHKTALWLLGLLVFMKGSIGLGTIFNGRDAAMTADGIPLDTFTAAGEQAFVSLLAAWGLGHFLLNLLGVLALVRYRAMVPLMFALLLVEHLARRLIFIVMPIVRTDDAPGIYFNLAFVAIMVVGLVMSVLHGDRSGVRR